MDDSIPERHWFGGVVARAGILGLALGAIGVAGPTSVLAGTGTGVVGVTVAVATIFLALAAGIWAGAPEVGDSAPPMRQRWFSSAAVSAVAGSYATFSMLFAQLYPGPGWRVAGLLIVIAAPAYMLGMLAPVLLSWVERWLDGEEEAEPLWTAIGVLTVTIFTGAAAGSLATGSLLLPVWSGGTILMAAAGLLLVPLLLGDPSKLEAREVDIFETVTPLSVLRVTEVSFPGERQPERRLYLNGEEESGELLRSGAPTLAYIAAAEDWLSRVSDPGSSYLFLGGGAYTLPRRIVERDSGARVTVVELDPEVTRIAYQFFGLREHHGISSLHGDARAFLEHDDPTSFDRIYVDVYAGHEELPYSLVTREAAAALAHRLNPGGMVAANVIGSVVGRENRQLWSVVRSFAEVFPNVKVYSHLGRDYPDRQNLLLAATLDEERALPSTAGHFDEWPRSEWPAVEGVAIFRDLDPSLDGSSAAPAARPS